jgi:biotin carboxyl carrier protein
MKIELTVRGRRKVVDVIEAGDGLVLHVDGHSVPVRLRSHAGSECFRLESGERTVPVRLRAGDRGAAVTVGPVQVRVGLRRALPVVSQRPSSAGNLDRVDVRAPMPGLVVAVPWAEGEGVPAGAAVAVVEAMKMQMEVPSPVAGRLIEIRVRPGQEVAGGQVLLVMQAEHDGSTTESGA